MYSYKTLVVEELDNIALIKINRPKSNNALSSAVMLELSNAIQNIDQDPFIVATVLTGTARVFASSQPLSETPSKTTKGRFLEEYNSYWELVQVHKKPLVAAINGTASGAGCDLLSYADFVIAIERAELGHPCIEKNYAPGFSGSKSLTSALGKKYAAELLETGRYLNGKEALQFGLVDEVVKPAKLLDAATMRACELGGCETNTEQGSKELARQIKDLHTSPDNWLSGLASNL